MLLDAPLREFLQAYPHEDTTRLVRGYLAWILIQKHELAEAAQLTDELSRGPRGAARDFAYLLEATLALQYDRPLDALRVLRPLQGKLIDPVERFLATEQLVFAALGATLYSEAIASMADWITQAGVLQREAIREAALSRLRRIPRRYLERALESRQTLSVQGELGRTHSQQQDWLYENISRLLIDRAVEERDADLARRILDRNPGALGKGDAAADLVRLATSEATAADTLRRSFGVVMNTTDPVAQRRSIEVTEAIALTLGLAQQTSEPGPLQMRVSETEDSLEQAMADLVEQGAGVLLAGVTEHDANLAASYSERARIPVLLLTPSVLQSPYAFSIGVSSETQTQLLTDALGRGVITRTLDAEQCEAHTAAGHAASTLASWQAEGTRAVVFLTDVFCTKRLLAEFQASKFQAAYLFGLTAAPVLESLATRERMRIRAHRFPLQRGDGQESDQLMQKLGRAPSWFEALGHDAAMIVRTIMAEIPAHSAAAVKDVEQVHEYLRAQLVSLHQTDLWTTQDARFDAQRLLTRSLKVEGSAGIAHDRRAP
jgi:hypothetical protein